MTFRRTPRISTYASHADLCPCFKGHFVSFHPFRSLTPSRSRANRRLWRCGVFIHTNALPPSGGARGRPGGREATDRG
eukprot:984671-Pleurochrysis_carterae.AAC.1